jgi:hypothetical protein
VAAAAGQGGSGSADKEGLETVETQIASLQVGVVMCVCVCTARRCVWALCVCGGLRGTGQSSSVRGGQGCRPSTGRTPSIRSRGVVRHGGAA